MAKIKRPPIASGPRVGQHATHSDGNRAIVLFSLEHIQSSHCLSNCERDEKAAFADALFKRRTLTWQELYQTQRHGLGSEKIHRNAIKAPIPSCVTADVEDFLALRFNSKAPMVGFRSQNIYYILWIDRDFTLYNH